jgi:hypothetical protein
MEFMALDVHEMEEQANTMIEGKDEDFVQDNK